MAVIGIPSSKILEAGSYFSPKKRPPRKGNAWTYRVVSARGNPDFKSIHSIYYVDGKLLHMSCYPETCLAHPYTISDDPELQAFSLEKHMARLMEALECPVIPEEKIMREPYPGEQKCRACHTTLSVYDVPRKKRKKSK